jgi:hypothetical protein
METAARIAVFSSLSQQAFVALALAYTVCVFSLADLKSFVPQRRLGKIERWNWKP